MASPRSADFMITLLELFGHCIGPAYPIHSAYFQLIFQSWDSHSGGAKVLRSSRTKAFSLKTRMLTTATKPVAHPTSASTFFLEIFLGVVEHHPQLSHVSCCWWLQRFIIFSLSPFTPIWHINRYNRFIFHGGRWLLICLKVWRLDDICQCWGEDPQQRGGVVGCGAGIPLEHSRTSGDRAPGWAPLWHHLGCFRLIRKGQPARSFRARSLLYYTYVIVRVYIYIYMLLYVIVQRVQCLFNVFLLSGQFSYGTYF